MRFPISSVLCVVVLFIVLSGTLSAAGGNKAHRIAKEELIPAELHVRRVGRANIDILYRRDKGFFPLISIFNYLRIKAVFSDDHLVVSGFYPKPEKWYELNLGLGEFKSADTVAVIASEDYLFSENEVYLKEDLFKAFFGLDMYYSSRLLRVTLKPTPDLPFFVMRQRERVRERALLKGGPIEPEYQIGRSPSMFEIGKIDWFLNSTMRSSKTPATRYRLRGGGKFLAGDLFLGVSGTAGKRVTDNNKHGYLRYPFENDFLREIRLGEIAPVGATTRSALGIEITNRPSGRRLVFGTSTLQTSLRASEEVELYNRGMLVQYLPVANDSLLTFPVATPYGTGDYELRIYDQWGQMRPQMFRTVVPQSMLPHGESQYSLSLGRLRGYNKNYGNMTMGYGFTQALTMGAGVEVLQKGFTKRAAYPFVTGTVRFLSSLYGEVFVSPLAVSRASLTLQLPSQVQLGVTQEFFSEDPVVNGGTLKSNSTFGYYVPFALGKTYVALSGSFSNSIAESINRRLFFGSMGIMFPAVQLQFAHDLLQVSPGSGNYTTIQQQTTPSITVEAPLRLILRGGFSYDHIQGRLQALNIGTSRSFYNRFLISYSLQRLFRPSTSFHLLNLNYFFPFANIQTNASRVAGENRNSQTTYQTTARGSVFFSSRTWDTHFSAIQRADRGLIMLKPFLDQNNNGSRDAGEEYLPRTKMANRTPYLSSSIEPAKNGSLMTNIEPYGNYTVIVDPMSTFDDPSLVPKYSAIGITSEPNVIKTVEVPIVRGGSIRGAVTFRTKDAPLPVQGISILLQRADTPGPDGESSPRVIKTTRTFGSGEYEFIAIPPGTYTITLSTDDLRSLGVAAMTGSRQVTVQPSLEGDIVVDVNFEVQ